MFWQPECIYVNKRLSLVVFGLQIECVWSKLVLVANINPDKMNSCNRLFIGFYLLLQNTKDRKLNAILLTIVFVAFVILDIIIIVERFAHLKMIPNLSRYQYIVFVLPFFFIMFLYYSKSRIEKLIKVEQDMPQERKQALKRSSIIYLVISIILFFVFGSIRRR